MAWTEDRVTLLAKLWAEGLSASQIAAELGGGVTRNAVIGKVHRLGLSGRAKSPKAASRNRKPRTMTTSAKSGAKRYNRSPMASARMPRSGSAALAYEPDSIPNVNKRPEKDVVIPMTRRLNILELTHHTCRWPIGDPGEQDFHFCGNDCEAEASYCTHHAKTAYQATSGRRRRAS